MTTPATPDVNGWLPIASAPKDGTPILVCFKGLGIFCVTWDDPHSDEVTPDNGIWCVDDNKHGPYAMRGYCEGDDTHWHPLPAPPVSS